MLKPNEFPSITSAAATSVQLHPLQSDLHFDATSQTLRYVVACFLKHPVGARAFIDSLMRPGFTDVGHGSTAKAFSAMSNAKTRSRKTFDTEER